MLRRISYSVTFPSTGRTLAADLKFNEGFTAITGSNETGKSMIFEVARWLLFGTDALRGKADDYKTLKGSGEFIIKGNVVEIDRTARGATMKRNGVVVATGTKPVNMKVVEELGFGMAVFDIANAIMQGEVEKLGEMKPAQRKAMIDSVLGLSALDNIAKWGAEEAKALDRRAGDLQEGLVHPGLAPVEPEGYEASQGLQERLQQASADADELATLTGWLAHERARPEKPTTKIDLPAANLTSLAEKRRAAREEVESLRARVNALPSSVVYSAELLDQIEAAWTAWHAYDEEARWAAQNPLPVTSVADLLEMEVAWSHRDDWARYDQQMAEVERLRTALEQIEKIDCPSCGHNFALHAEHAARLGAELELAEQRASDIPPVVDRPDEPKLKSVEIARLQQAWETVDVPRHQAFEAMEKVEKPDLSEREVVAARQQIEQVAERGRLGSDLSVAEQKFSSMADYEAMLAERRQYEEALASWQTAAADYERWLAEREQKMRRKAELAGAAERRDSISFSYRQAVDYEAQVARFDEAKNVWDRQQAQITELKEQAAEHRKVREVMAILRGLIKQHVLPSLNTVSSQLLRQMTGGQRNFVYIDDDFNVQVDAQDLDTLSGSGKACANLAIRIALGQVLTNRVISIMLADEIDASMDAFRAEQTSNVLQMLEERVSQVLLVSHKPVDAPHHVRLGGFSDDDDDGGQLGAGS